MAGHGGGSEATWDCSCGAKGHWASRAACRACGAERPPWARPRSASASARGRSGATAGASKVEALRRELDGPKENQAVAELRGLITKLEALGSEDEALVSLLASCRSEMARIQEEQRLAKPPHEQLRAIDSKIGELDKRCVAKQEQVAKRKEALANAEKELEAVLAERAALSAERAKVATSHLAELAAKVPSEVAAAVQLVEEWGKQEAASVAAQPRSSDAGGGASAEPFEVLASQEEADAADAAMHDALESALAADLVGPGGDCDRPPSGLSREKIRGVIAAARTKAADRRSGGSGGVIKKKREDTFEIMTANGSGRGAITQLWQEEVAGAGFVESRRADAWLIQEAHLHAGDINTQEAWCRRAEVKAALAPGAASSGGAGGARAASGGVGVAVPAARGLVNAGAAGGGRVTCSDGRGIVAVTDAVRRGGIAPGSIYLANDAVGEASQRPLVEIGDALVSLGRPWVIGGGFNAAPDVFKAKAGWWLEAVQGVIVQSTEGETCFQAATPTNLDYFIVHRCLAESVRSCSTVTPGPFRPHCAVKLVLNARMEIAPLRVLKQPRACPRELPIGPRREAAPPSADLQAHCGRGLEPEERWVNPTSDHPQISGGPKSSGQARHLLAVADYLDDAAVQRRTRRRVPARAAKSCGARWVAALAAVAVATANALAGLASEARAKAAAMAVEHSRHRHGCFNRWVLDALEHGAGGLHAWRRGPRGWLEDELDLLGAPRAGQREVGAVGRYWAHEVWSLDDGSDGWQDFEKQTDSEALPRPTAVEWLDAAKSFAKRTGTGVDRVSPRAFAQVSDATAEIFVDIGMAAEEWGGWPLAARASLIAMLPKIWNKLGQAEARRWEASLRGSGAGAFWGGPGRSAQVSAWRQALAAEAAGGRQLHGAALLIDLEKEYGACSDGDLKSDMHMFYDDTTVACHGRAPRQIARHLVEAGLAVAAGLTLLGCRTSGTKTEAALKASTLSAKLAKVTKNLGVDFCLDGSAAAGVARGRHAEAREQLGRVGGARRQSISAAVRLLAGGLLPTTAHGCCAQVGSALAAAPWRDPWCSQAEQAPMAWGRGLARNRPDTTLDVLWAWRRAVQVRLEQGPGALAGRGPAAAALLALERLGWDSTAMHRWAVDNGTALKLEEIGGRALRRSSARSAALGGLRPVARRAALDPPLRRSGACPAGCGGRGTVRHLARRRPALAAERRDAIAGDVVLQAFADVAEASDSEGPRYSRALIPDQTAALPPLLKTEEVRWSSSHGYAALAGANVLYTDGSAMHGKAGSPEDANAGEIMAAARALRWGLPGANGVLEIRTDCKLLVTGFAAGKAWCCAWDRPYMEVWREFWQAVDSFGGQQCVRVTNVKGHATLRSVHDGHTRMDDYDGNRAADSFAKTGAELHPMSEAAMERIELADAIAVAAARWLGEALQLGSTALTAADGADAGAAESTCCGRSCGRRGAARCSDGGPGCSRWPCGAHGTAVSDANGTRWLCDACAGRWDGTPVPGGPTAASAGSAAGGPPGPQSAGRERRAPDQVADPRRGRARTSTSTSRRGAEGAGAAAAAAVAAAALAAQGPRRLVHCAVCGCYADGARVVALRSPCAGGASARQAAALRRMRLGRHTTRGGAGALLEDGRTEPLRRQRSRSRGRGSEAGGPSR
ncbi:unnamed protein product [Prorocentrum cordatum]|uniref:RNase H type-1 domain-containing protein n=1 Tax=Prorocentrum cordatum TaxID=2364126 RepID=A0ABN9XJ10_9DINO|nr:unnamed protein product [Polarella glacialis]